MLNFRASGIGQGIMAAIVLLIIVTFAMSYRTGAQSATGALSEKCAVDYARHCVDSKDFYAALGLIGPRVSPKDSKAMALRHHVLEGLAERELLYEAAKKLDIGVSDDTIEQELTAGRAYVSLPVEDAEQYAPRLGLCRRSERGIGCEPGTPIGVRQLRVRRTASEPFDYTLYQKEIRLMTNRGPKEFRVTQERELVAQRLRELVLSRVRVPDGEAFAIYERNRSRVVVRSVTLDVSWFGRFAIDVSDAAVQKWAAANASLVDDSFKAQADEFAPECPLVSEIVVPIAANALDAEKAPARERIQALRERVQKGEAFESVAREASVASSAAFGGRVGCPTSSYGPDAEEVRTAAKKLEKGALSDVIETSHAFVVLRLDGKLDKATAAKDGRAQVARSVYQKNLQTDAMNAFAKDIAAKVKAGAKLEDVVNAKTDELARRASGAKSAAKPAAKPGEKDAASPPGLLATDRPKFEVSAPFTSSGNPLPDVEPKESLVARAFALEQPDELDEKPIETTSGLVMIQLKEKMSASREEFEKDKWTIVTGLRQAKARDALVRYVAELRRAAGDKLKIHDEFGNEPKSTSDE